MSGGQRGLGRGIGALIPGRAAEASPPAGPAGRPAWAGDGSAAAGVPSTVPGAYFAELPVEAIRPNARQPRAVFDDSDLAELVASIEVVGLLQPIVVRAAGDGTYELIMGERRWRATRSAGLTTIAAIVRDTSDDAMLRDALLENLHRAELNALEEAAAYQQLLDDFGCTHDELATRLGRSRPHISNTIRLLRLTPRVQRRVAAGVLSAGHARALLAVEDPGLQEQLAARAVAEGISVRGLEELVVSARPPKEPRVRKRQPRVELSDGVAHQLSEHLETRCHVVHGSRRGRIVVEFADERDLDRIASAMLGEPTSR